MAGKLDMTAALGGALYPVLALAGLLVMAPTLPPDFEAPPADIANHLSAHPAGPATAIGISLELTGLLMLVLFAHLLTAWLADDWTSRAAAAVAGIGATVKIASASPVLIALWYADGLTAQTKATLFRLNDGFVPVSEAAVFVFILLSGHLILTTGRLPEWLGWYAAASSILAAADLWAQTAILEIPALLWLPVASIALARTTRNHTTSLPQRSTPDARSHPPTRPNHHHNV